MQGQVLETSDVAAAGSTLIDGGVLIHAKLAATKRMVSYGDFALETMRTVCKEFGNNIHVLLDTYSNNDLKAQEREKRGADSDVQYVIGGPDQNPGVSNERCMKSSSFKNELCNN